MDVTNGPGDGPEGGPPKPPAGRAGPARASLIGALTRKSGFVRRVAHSWRTLTGGGAPTLVACSGGADSVALVLALALTTPDLIVGHVVHDLRPRPQALEDARAVQELAGRLGLRCAVSEVAVGPGNAEAGARRERYAALAGLAAAHGCRFVATGHHADDQFETLLMALLRGAGPAGLRGIAARRSLGQGVQLVRPMLGCTRAEAEEACRTAGVAWRIDATNFDVSRFRASLRHGPMASLLALRPGAARRAAVTAELMRDATLVMEERIEATAVRAARGVGADAARCGPWSRAGLRAEPLSVVAGVLRRGALGLTGRTHADAMGSRVVLQAGRAVRDGVTDPRQFQWPGLVTVRVTAHEVELSGPTSD